jgi:hypothetical protein
MLSSIPLCSGFGSAGDGQIQSVMLRPPLPLPIPRRQGAFSSRPKEHLFSKRENPKKNKIYQKSCRFHDDDGRMPPILDLPGFKWMVGSTALIDMETW